MTILALLAGLAFAARAGQLPSPFEAQVPAAVERGLSEDPFFASKVALSFSGHAQAVAQLPDARAAAGYLKWQVAGPQPVAAPSHAAALLLAGALAAPAQFNRVAARLEELKPGLGARLVTSFQEAAQGARFPAMKQLQDLAGRLNAGGQAKSYGPPATALPRR